MNNLAVSPSPDALAVLDRFMAAQGFDAAARADVTARLAVGSVAELPPVVTWERFRAEVIAQYAPALRAKATRRTILNALRSLEALGVNSIADLNVQTIARFVSAQPPEHSPNTVKSHLRSIQSICSLACQFEYLPVSPFVKRPIRTWVRGAKPEGVRHLTKVQIRAIREMLARDVEQKVGWGQWRSRRDQALFDLVAHTGLRSAEALHCYVADLDLDQGIVWVVSRAAHRLKTAGSESFVVLPPPAVATLLNWLNHRMDAPDGFERAASPFLFPNLRAATPWTSGSTGHTPLARLKAVAKRCGIDVATYQALRRSVATHMEAGGAGAAQIQRQLRHSNVGTTQTFYMQADRDNMRQAMDGFSY